MSAFDDPDAFRKGLAEFNRQYAHEFTREYRRGKTPAIFADEPILDEPSSLVEIFEQQQKRKNRLTTKGKP